MKAGDFVLWGVSSLAVIVSFFVCKNTQYHYLVGSLIGISALTFVSKGHPFGQVLILIFAVFYGVISFSFRYYGEMITYLGMSAPFAVVSLVSWLKNPYKSGEVKVNSLSKREWILFPFLSVGVTVAFYFILSALGTNKIWISTLSVLTSFTAAYLTARRCRFYAVCYALNDVVLIAMWAIATADDIYYLPMIVCFCAFLALDIHGFINWSAMRKRQKSE